MCHRTPKSILLAGLLFGFLGGGFAQQVDAQHGGQYAKPPSVTEYLDQLEHPERDEYQKPAQVIEALGVKRSMAVADLGSGSGYFTRRFAKAVAEVGKVYAIDVEVEALKRVKDSLKHMQGASSVEFILAPPDNPKLPGGSVDLIFLCNAYHHLQNRSHYFANVHSALRPNGRIAVIDFYHDQRSGDLGFPKDHLVSRETVLDEMAKAGYRLLREHTFLPKQYFLEFAPVGL